MESIAPIEQASKLLAKLPGLGRRSAQRAILAMLTKRNGLLMPLIAALQEMEQAIVTCDICGNLDSQAPCSICQSHRRQKDQICVVERVADLWALERAGAFSGHYHILGGTLSALDGVGPEELNVAMLTKRAADPKVKEIIFALSATVDGQTTAHYLAEQLRDCGISLSSIAHGVPVGGELDYLDDGTLSAALQRRNKL